MNQTDDWTGRFARMAHEQDELDALRAENERLRAELSEALAQNERFNIRYRNSEAELERLRALFHLP